MPLPAQLPASTFASIEALLLQERALDRLVASLQARVKELRRQLDATTPERKGPLREQLSRTNLEHVDAKAQLAAVRNEIRHRVGTDLLTEMRPPIEKPYIPGEGVAAAGIIFILAVLMPLSIGFTRRLWKRGAPAPKVAVADNIVSSRLERLEHAVDAIAIEIERVSEGQRFMTKVMSERPAAPVNQAEAADPSVLSEMKPYIALGAGPVESIPVAQRQAVKHSITPH